MAQHHSHSLFFFFNDTATTEIYTLSLHDALPISPAPEEQEDHERREAGRDQRFADDPRDRGADEQRLIHERSEEHTSELQSRSDLVCRLLLEKKKETRKRK